jgi:hypothetical protein
LWSRMANFDVLLRWAKIIDHDVQYRYERVHVYHCEFPLLHWFCGTHCSRWTLFLSSPFQLTPNVLRRRRL